jgi:hypothetical protein
MSPTLRSVRIATVTRPSLTLKARWITVVASALGGVGIALAVLPAYSWLLTTTLLDALAAALTRLLGTSMAALILIYAPGSLVAACIGLCVSLAVGLLVPSVRSSTGIWMGLIAGVTYLGLAIVSDVSPHLVTFLEVCFLVGSCVAGLSAARWLMGRPHQDNAAVP